MTLAGGGQVVGGAAFTNGASGGTTVFSTGSGQWAILTVQFTATAGGNSIAIGSAVFGEYVYPSLLEIMVPPSTSVTITNGVLAAHHGTYTIFQNS